MQRYSLFDNPIAISILFFIVLVVNIFLPIHFISILLAGVVFTAFVRSLEKKYNYSLFFLIIAFIIIEVSQGLKIFSLSLLSLFIYLFIVPKLKSVFSSLNIYLITILLIFYLGVILLYRFLGDVNAELISIILINFFIDIFIVGFII